MSCNVANPFLFRDTRFPYRVLPNSTFNIRDMEIASPNNKLISK